MVDNITLLRFFFPCMLADNGDFSHPYLFVLTDSFDQKEQEKELKRGVGRASDITNCIIVW